MRVERPDRQHPLIEGGRLSRRWDRFFDELSRTLNDSPFTGRVFLNQVFAAGSTVQLAHELGRAYTGFLALNLRSDPSSSGAAAVFIDSTAIIDTSSVIPLHSERALTCDLWIY